MGHHRHHMHKKAKGGRVVYEGAGSHVAHEAEEKKHGGKVHEHHHHAHGHKGKHRIKKARGGGIGSDKAPFSSAGRGGMDAHPAHGGHGMASHEGGKGGFTGGHHGKG